MRDVCVLALLYVLLIAPSIGGLFWFSCCSCTSKSLQCLRAPDWVRADAHICLTFKDVRCWTTATLTPRRAQAPNFQDTYTPETQHSLARPHGGHSRHTLHTWMAFSGKQRDGSQAGTRETWRRSRELCWGTTRQERLRRYDISAPEHIQVCQLGISHHIGQTTRSTMLHGHRL